MGMYIYTRVAREDKKAGEFFRLSGVGMEVDWLGGNRLNFTPRMGYDFDLRRHVVQR